MASDLNVTFLHQCHAASNLTVVCSDGVIFSHKLIAASASQGYLFCSFAEFFNSAKNSQDCEIWKKTTKFTPVLSRF